MNNNIPKCSSPPSLQGKEIYVVGRDMKECTSPTDINAWESPDGDYLALHCRAEAEPIPTYQWFKGMCNQPDSLEVVSNEETIYLKRKEDEGEYKCVASNFKGNIEKCITAKLPSKPQSYDQDFSQEEPIHDQTIEIVADLEQTPNEFEDDSFPDMKQFDEEYEDDCKVEDCFCQRRYDKLWVDCRQQELHDFNDIKDLLPEDMNILDLKDNEFDMLDDRAFINFGLLERLHLDENDHLGEGLGREVFMGLFNLIELTAKDIG